MHLSKKHLTTENFTMGLDLKLLICFRKSQYAHTLLECVRNGDLFKNIRNLPSSEIDSIESYLSYDVERGCFYGEITQDAYGDGLRWVSPEKLLSVEGLIEDCKINYAVWQYIKHLPSDTRIVLYWC